MAAAAEHSAPRLAACRKEFVEAPSLEEIIHYDQWARRFVAERVESRNPVAA